MTDDIDEIVRRIRNGNYSELILKDAADALERMKAERDFARDSIAKKNRQYDADMKTMQDALNREIRRAEAAEKRLNGCRQWLRANANAERNPDARAAFIEAHNAILAIIEDRA